jgi:hypothetical protein
VQDVKACEMDPVANTTSLLAPACSSRFLQDRLQPFLVQTQINWGACGGDDPIMHSVTVRKA